METHRLIPHPARPPLGVRQVEARVVAASGPWLRLRWRIDGAERVVLPRFAGKGRADGLWRTTCFEAFLREPGSEAYVEVNLSPSERWAAYDFSGPRRGMTERPLPHEPECTARVGSSMTIFDAAVPLAAMPPLPWQAGLAAVIEEEGGVLSYWALAHPQDHPDFHDPACFAIEVPAPAAP
ncbi:MAG: DOMON-like domain-containing protein [Novosphingobium sp.]|nr:DOMON-like domain-containing protein [Novosphingobium sp.]